MISTESFLRAPQPAATPNSRIDSLAGSTARLKLSAMRLGAEQAGPAYMSCPQGSVSFAVADFCAAAPLPPSPRFTIPQNRDVRVARERGRICPCALEALPLCVVELSARPKGISPSAAFRVTRDDLSAPSRFRTDGLASTVLTVAPAFQFRVRSQALQQLFAKVLQRFVGFLLFRQSLAEQVARFLIAH